MAHKSISPAGTKGFGIAAQDSLTYENMLDSVFRKKLGNAGLLVVDVVNE